MYRKIIFTGATVVVVSLLAGDARAQSCPSPAADESLARRTLAKEWFGRAEESETAGNRDAAVKQYACSLRLVPHPSTAFNLAVAAERSGDPSMAADAFRAYLRLMPDASDRAAVEARIGRLEKQVLELRQQFDEPAPPRAPPKLKTGPAAKAAPAARFLADADSDPLPPLHLPGSSPREGERDLEPESESEPELARERRLPPWPLFAGAAASAATGAIFNLVARSKMTTCRDPALRASDRPTADAACTSAPAYAYGSYALLGLGGALAVVGGVVAFTSGEGSDQTSVTLAPTAGGGALIISGGF